VETNDDTEKLLRSSALRTANSILLARQRAEQELIHAKQALELKTEELAHSLSMMRATLESTTDGILVTDGCGTVTGFNEKYVEMWRMPRAIIEARQDQPLREVASQQFKDPQQFIARIREIEASSLPESFDLLEFADGRVFERYSNVQCIEDRRVGRVWSFRDITERRRGEEKLRASRERSEQLWATTTDAIIIMDGKMRVEYVNPAVTSVFGYSEQEVIERGMIILMPERLRGAHRHGLQSYLDTRVRKLDWRATEIVGLHRDGYEFPIEISFSHFKEGERDIFAAFIRDITERKQAQETLRAAKIAAERANQAKDDFLAVLSHELRTPLTPALAAASYLAEHEELPPELHEEVTAIRRNVQFEARLIDDLLDLTRITRGKLELHPEAVDAHRLLHNALTIVHEDIARKELKVVTDLGAHQHHVWADPIRIQQVFWNLLNNAVKFTPKGGRIMIRSSNDGGRFSFEITDTGIGIEPEQQERIFNAFEQAELSITRQFGGLGLGLTISDTLLKLHGGTISVQSEGKNRGASFRVTLDALHDPALASTSATNGEASTSRALRLLLVDDHADTRRTLSRLLGKCGHEVSTADCAQSALELLDRGRFDALISDIGLPDHSGYELVREAKERQPLKGIALSGFGMEEDVRRSLEAGFDYHLTKPVEFDELRSLLQKITS
jgi:PAS domain S-box-containing protein